MAGYKLSRTALREVAELVSYLHREASPSVADKIEDRLFAALNDLANGRALGHRRTDLTIPDVLFHLASPYGIIFRRTRQTVFVVHVIHGSRDLSKLL